MDEATDRLVRLLSARLPGWTVWYGRHTGHFWALSKRRPATHVEAVTAADLENRVVKAEYRLARPRIRRAAGAE